MVAAGSSGVALRGWHPRYFFVSINEVVTRNIFIAEMNKGLSVLAERVTRAGLYSEINVRRWLRHHWLSFRNTQGKYLSSIL